MEQRTRSPSKVVTDSAGLNQALFQVTHGLYVLTARDGGKINGQCLDALMQVTNAPPRIAIGVGKQSLTHEMIARSGRFVANVIDRDDPLCEEVVRLFGFQSGRKADKFAGISFTTSEQGIPILPDAKAYFECTILPELTTDLKTHSLFVATVDQAGTNEQGEPFTYNEYRKRMKKGGQ
ncbi:flavin reductase [Candidatus Bipolaricaulota bacterium]|nr:flavin reductase [Candidatus Bipolaricaulota bacterium]